MKSLMKYWSQNCLQDFDFFSSSPEELAWSSVQRYSCEVLLSTCFTPVKVRGGLDPASPVAFPTSVGYWFIPAQIEMSAAESA